MRVGEFSPSDTAHKLLGAERTNYLLFFSMPECQACDRMSQAFSNIDQSVIPAVVLRFKILLEDRVSREVLAEFDLRDFPTLIWFSGGIEQKRWGGFFDDPCPNERRDKLKNLLLKALNYNRGGQRASAVECK